MDIISITSQARQCVVLLTDRGTQYAKHSSYSNSDSSKITPQNPINSLTLLENQWNSMDGCATRSFLCLRNLFGLDFGLNICIFGPYSITPFCALCGAHWSYHFLVDVWDGRTIGCPGFWSKRDVIFFFLKVNIMYCK